jgi:hypothetical protein
MRFCCNRSSRSASFWRSRVSASRAAFERVALLLGVEHGDHVALLDGVAALALHLAHDARHLGPTLAQRAGATRPLTSIDWLHGMARNVTSPPTTIVAAIRRRRVSAHAVLARTRRH